jgi:hypothetical protein
VVECPISVALGLAGLSGPYAMRERASGKQEASTSLLTHTRDVDRWESTRPVDDRWSIELGVSIEWLSVLLLLAAWVVVE